MFTSAAATFLAALVMLPLQASQKTPASGSEKRTPLTLTGCVSESPGSSGEFAFLDSESGGRYRLTGKGIRKVAGHRVEITGGPNTKLLSFRVGLLPSPNVAAQAGAMDPAQMAIASQPGGTGAGTGVELPEFHVTRLRPLEGACR